MLRRPLQDALAAAAAQATDPDAFVHASWPPSGDGWALPTSLVEDRASFTATVDAFCADWGTRRRDIGGAFWLRDVALAVMTRAAATFLVMSRVPLLGSEVAVRTCAGATVSAVAFGSRFCCTHEDPRATHPSATVVADRSAVLGALLAAYAGWLAPLVTAVNLRCRRPRPALWRHGGDVLAESFLNAGEALGRREDAWHWGAVAAESAPAPLRTHAGYRLFGDVRHPGRVRAQCCLYYRTDAAAHCFSCPLKGDEHRLARLAETVTEAT